jgi:SAM-dependent methyltransferase
MDKFTDQKYLVTEQYRDARNLEARLKFHQRFSTSRQPWFEWVFDHLLMLPEKALVLEIGCGTGELWMRNRERIPPGWELCLGDLSYGMIQVAKQNLRFLTNQVTFQVLDVQLLKYANATFDAVIANHVLYHAPNVPRAILEIARVLKPGGTLFAATNGISHLQELYEIIRNNPILEQILQSEEQRIHPPDSFTLENGAELLAAQFGWVTKHLFPDRLEVAEVEPLQKYILSLAPASARQVTPALNQEIQKYLDSVLAQAGGRLTIRKSPGMFIARKQNNHSITF